MKIVGLSVSLEHVTPDALQLLERAGRTCYKSEDKITDESAAKFVKMIVEKGHHTILEHAHATLRVTSDRGVSHEFVRHRIMTFSQESTRYCNYSKDRHGGEITLVPMNQGLTAEQLERRFELWLHAERVYLAELSEGVSPQQARDNLPTCLKTEFVVTANFREWLHFLSLRHDGKAGKPHPQMKEVAGMIKSILSTVCPVVFGESVR